MSIKIHIDSVPIKIREKMIEDLEIEIEGSSYVYNSRPRYIYPAEVGDEYAYIPFSYAGYCEGGPFPRPERKSFSNKKIIFNGKLREHQRDVTNEALKYLNKKGSVIISAFPGFGKCLSKNTPIIMYDGNVKKVQDIKVGDTLMGDDSTARNVLSVCKGREQMYKIIPFKGEEFGCNESHILSLKNIYHKKGEWNWDLGRYIVNRYDSLSNSFKIFLFRTISEVENYVKNISDSEEIIEITVKKYLELSYESRKYLKLYKVGVEFSEKKICIDPYFVGVVINVNIEINNGNIDIKTDTNHNKDVRLYLSKIFKVEEGCNNNYVIECMEKYDLIKNNKRIPEEFKYNSRKNRMRLLAGIVDITGKIFDNDKYIIKLYGNRNDINDKKNSLVLDIIYLIQSLGFIIESKYQENNIYKIIFYGKYIVDIPIVNYSKKINKTFSDGTEMLSDFKVVPIYDDNKYYGFMIDGNHRFLLGDFTVTHNTCSGIYLSSKISMKTLIIVHRVVLAIQWKKSIEKFSPESTVQILKAKDKMEDCDFYIMNAVNIPKRDMEDYKDIGCLIVDECHLIMAEGLSKSMQKITPRYVIGLSATPYRYDNLNILLELYFGKETIYRKLYREHNVYKIKTNFTPEIEKSKNNTTIWTSVIKSQALNLNRNEMIIRLVKFFPERVFLILCKIVNQAKYLVKRLEEEKIDVTSLIGSQQEFDHSSRVLVGITSKTGIGFDHPRLDSIILASDIESFFIQYLGRCMRTEDGVPYIFDIVDKNYTLERHFKTRRAVYLETGGRIKHMNKKFPEFSLE